MAHSIKILIVDANPVRAAIIEEGLREAGSHEIVMVGGTSGLVAAIMTEQARLIFRIALFLGNEA